MRAPTGPPPDEDSDSDVSTTSSDSSTTSDSSEESDSTISIHDSDEDDTPSQRGPTASSVPLDLNKADRVPKFYVFVTYYETVEKHLTLKLTFNRRTSARLMNQPVSVLKNHFLENCKEHPSGIGANLRADDCHLASERGSLADDDLIGTYICRKEDLKLEPGMSPSRGHFPTRSVWCWGSCFGKGTIKVPSLVSSLERRQVTQVGPPPISPSR